jgi:hypothetical protein
VVSPNRWNLLVLTPNRSPCHLVSLTPHIPSGAWETADDRVDGSSGRQWGSELAGDDGDRSSGRRRGSELAGDGGDRSSG